MKRLDISFLAACLVLLVAGLSTLYSIGITSGETIFIRQLIFALIGMAAFFGAAFVDYRLLALKSRYLYILALIFLLIVLFTQDIRGSSRWISLGGINFQPVEFAKIALIVGLARFFSLKRGEVKSAKVLMHVIIFAAIPAILVGLQPDLGSAVLLMATAIGLLLVSPIRKFHVIFLVVFILAVGVSGWYGFLHDYQKERILTFINPAEDPQGSGYNVRQSIIAVGSGQFWGRGLGRGLQSHLRFLPERHTDFIFASFAEELGFIGSILLISVFGLLLWRLIKTGLN